MSAVKYRYIELKSNRKQDTYIAKEHIVPAPLSDGGKDGGAGGSLSAINSFSSSLELWLKLLCLLSSNKKVIKTQSNIF